MVVEDSAACQKTIQSPVSQQVLKTDGAGNLTWTNGASGTVLRKDSTGLLEFATLNSVLQSGPVDLGSQPLTTNAGVVCQKLEVYNPIGVAGIEVGGIGTAFIDLKSPNPDDNDIRLGTNGTGGFLSTSNNGDIVIDPGTGSVGISGNPQAKFTVVKGTNLIGSAQFIGSQESTFFHNSVDEHTYIRGGKTTSNVYLNDTSTGFTAVGSGGLGINTTPTSGRRLHVNGLVKFTSLPTYANNAAALSGGLTNDDVYKTATGELRIVV